MYYVNFTAGENEYRLRLDIMATMALEKQLGCNPLAIFGDGDKLPTITAMIQILHASMQEMQHGVTVNAAAKVFERWMKDGHTPPEFVPIIFEIYKASGIVKPENETSEKNA